ncbi:hypothetical protein [Leucobacter sp. gxy201]|uniref:hypothetical protein n=1 Tax=Leucobacter sp. gxy201 TaxID=2957200 RepID=UPI003DA136E7
MRIEGTSIRTDLHAEIPNVRPELPADIGNVRTQIIHLDRDVQAITKRIFPTDQA